MGMLYVTALGELLIDFAPQSVNAAGYPTLAANPGGAPANFLAAVKKYGQPAAMIGKVGDDMFGRLLTRTLKEAGIETRGVVMDPAHFTTMAFVSLDENGNRDFSFARKPGADTCLTEEDLDTKLLENSRVFHFGTLSLTDEPARSATLKAITTARQNGALISLDPNLRLPLWPDEQTAHKAIDWSLRQADIVKISDEEIKFMWGLNPEQGVRKIFTDYSASLVYATLGAKGCFAATRTFCLTVPAPGGIQVKDTTGAGDIFGGSAMSRFLQYKKRPNMLIVNELEEIVRFACAAASLSTQTYGGISSVPDIKDVFAKMNEDKPAYPFK